MVSWHRSCSRSREAILSWSISTLPPDSSTSRNRAVTSELLPDPVRPTIPVPQTQNDIDMTMLYLLQVFVSGFHPVIAGAVVIQPNFKSNKFKIVLRGFYTYLLKYLYHNILLQTPNYSA